MTKQVPKKQSKSKLTSLVLLLFFTIIMFSTTSYAWFMISRIIIIDRIEINVLASSGLQVSANGFDWKMAITQDDLHIAHIPGHTGIGAYDHVNQIPHFLEATSTIGEVLPNGHMRMFNGTVVGYRGSFALISDELEDKRGTEGSYIAFDMFVKNEADVDIFLSHESMVVPVEGTTDTGLRNAARAAFVLPWNDELNRSQAVSTIAPLSEIQGQIGTRSFIWEPNYNLHTPYAEAEALSRRGIDLNDFVDRWVPYDGLRAPIPMESPIILTQTNSIDFPDFFEPVIPDVKTRGDYYQTIRYEPMFRLGSGITKIRIYMWIEGQDVDCENHATGANISFNIRFTLDSERQF